jgi:2,3-dihydroxyphenylpropionate 1,2-dioxygenase
MPVALCATSHTPLMEHFEPAPEVRRDVDSAFLAAREFVRAFDPQLVVLFGPDHYNGFFYNLMPPFCIGAAAESVGDWGTHGGPLDVDSEVARLVARRTLEAGIDLAISERMYVDHGFVQPLELIFGTAKSPPIVPVFVNCVAEPFGPLARVRLLGEAVGHALQSLDQRVLLLASGGLSHDPPVPTLQTATAGVAEFLVAGEKVTPAGRAERESRIVAAGAAFAAGDSDRMPLNPAWDEEVLDALTSGGLNAVDAWTPEWFVQHGGHSAHEVRTWIAAYAALSVFGAYEIVTSFYAPIPEWMAGFGLTAARPTAS